MVSILYEYRWYFPLNFVEANFLVSREAHFFGAYACAFYTHIVSGPIALLNAAFLMFSGDRFIRLKLHRWMGRLQILFVSLVCVSGVVMARQAFAGPIAGVGFGVLAVLTMATAVASAYCAIKRQFISHRKWATRCFILLCSPMLLRLISGAAIVLGVESESIYRLNAWFSWLIPLAIFESVHSQILKPRIFTWRRLSNDELI